MINKQHLEHEKKQRYPLLIPPLDVYRATKQIRFGILGGYPLYKDFIFKPLHSGLIKEFRRNNYLRDISLSTTDGTCSIKAHLNVDAPLNYTFLSTNQLFNRDWHGKMRFFTKTGKSEAILRKAFARHGLTVTSQYNCSDFQYTLDFAYVDPESQVKINIEVDEDYHFSAEQIHKDRYRNYFLSKRGWGVVRLTERQVMKAPDACARFIIHLIQAGKVSEELWHSLNQVECLVNHESFLTKESKTSIISRAFTLLNPFKTTMVGTNHEN